MKLPKTVYLIAFLIFLVIVLILVQIFSSKSRPASRVSPAPTPQLTITGTSLTDQPVGVTGFIKINFNKTVSLERLRATITPPTEVVYSLDATLRQLSIAPKNAWNFNKVYTIRIFVDKDYEFTFRTIPFGGM